eukprot:jgi/Chlat1/108/Chrsp1S03089
MEELAELSVTWRVMGVLRRHGCVAATGGSGGDGDRRVAAALIAVAGLCQGTADLCTFSKELSSTLAKVTEAVASELPAEMYHRAQSHNAGEVSHKTVALGTTKHRRSSHDVQLQVGLRAMQRSQSSLEDFVRSYFMFHELAADAPCDVFRYLPMLSFLDQENEDRLQPGHVESHERGSQALDPFDGLKALLQRKGLSSPLLFAELDDGASYWRLETDLCNAMDAGQKSFDYRVLNLLLYALRGSPVNETHMRFLSASELLVEIADDLHDYEEDVEANCFNVYRAFIRIHGVAEGPVQLSAFISAAEADYAKCMSKLDPALAQRYAARCDEAALEGGADSKSGYWQFPMPISDERAFRQRLMSPG